MHRHCGQTSADYIGSLSLTAFLLFQVSERQRKQLGTVPLCTQSGNTLGRRMQVKAAGPTLFDDLSQTAICSALARTAMLRLNQLSRALGMFSPDWV